MKRIVQHPPRPKKLTMWRSLAELENSPGETGGIVFGSWRGLATGKEFDLGWAA
jgi:hypothetical protein